MAKKNIRKYAAVGLGILGVAGLSLASASQLLVTTDTIAVGSQVFASCDTDGINVGYTTGTFAGGSLPVTGIVVGSGTGVSKVVHTDCNGKTYTVSVLDAAGAPIAGQTYTGTIALTAGSFTITPNPLGASAVYGVVVVIK